MATKVKLIADGVITPDQITLTTASTGTNTTAPATTAFVQQEISALVDSSPDALNTLNELAAALGDDENFSTTVTNSIATKLPLAGGTLTGALTLTADANPALEISRGSANTTNVNLKYNTTLTGQLSAANAEFQISAAGSSTPMEFFTNGSERMRITPDGRLQFSQVGATDTNNSIFAHTNNYLYLEGGSSGIVLADNSANSNRILVRDTNIIEFQTSGATRATINAAGNTGAVLDLEPNANIDGSLYSALTINEQHSTAHSGVRFDRSGTAKYRVGIDNNDNFQIANFRTTTDDAAFVMDVDSDIGIGTASPAGSLHIHRDSNENSPEIRITTGKDSGTPTAQMSYSAGSGYFLRLPDAANNEDVMIRSYGDTVFHGGSVSIGDQLKVGSFASGQTNTGEAWLGRASDRNEGTLTVQLGGGTTGRTFEIVDHDWQKVLVQINGNAEGGALNIPATEGGSAGNTGITMRNKHPGNAEPYTSLDVRELQTTNGYGGIGMYSNLQSHLRFKTGGGSTTWGNGTGHQWQLRMGNGASEDQMEFYAWTGNKRVHRMYGSNGAHTMEYQLGGRFGLPSNQTVTTSWSNLNFSDTNSTYLMYNQGLTNSSGEITVPVAGRYAISARFRTEATPFRAPTQFAIYVDNSGSGSGSYVQIVRLYITSNTQSSYEHAPPLDAILNLVAGARFVVRAIAGSASFVLSSTSNTVNHLSVMKLA